MNSKLLKKENFQNQRWINFEIRVCFLGKDKRRMLDMLKNRSTDRHSVNSHIESEDVDIREVLNTSIVTTEVKTVGAEGATAAVVQNIPQTEKEKETNKLHKEMCLSRRLMHLWYKIIGFVMIIRVIYMGSWQWLPGSYCKWCCEGTMMNMKF